jgi:hypothetical protein
MKTVRPLLFAFSTAAGIGFLLFWLWACGPERTAEKTPATGPPPVNLLAEDEVRLSNDPQKTEVFRDAGLGSELPDGNRDLLAAQQRQR